MEKNGKKMKWNPFALESEAKKEAYKFIDKNLRIA